MRLIVSFALMLASAVIRAEDACPSLSGCAYQAGQGLPGRDAASRQAASPERPPVIVNSCDAGGCIDPNGTRYNGRSEPENNVYLDPQGRRCVRSGDRLQCD
jgi:hypothetical protein